jgi:hypothetical protein
MVDIEDLSEQELDKLKKFYITLSELAAQEDNSMGSHSIDEAHQKHKAKQQ